MARFKKQSKYHARKCSLPTGEVFDSVRERDRYLELCLLQRAGQIEELQRQIPFVLIDSVYDEVQTGEIYQRGDKKGQPKFKKVCIERPLTYIADFLYTDSATGETVVEDVKGYKKGTAYDLFVAKRKLMLLIHNIRVREV